MLNIRKVAKNVAYSGLKYYSTFSHKRHEVLQTVAGHKMRFFNFSMQFMCEIFSSKD